MHPNTVVEARHDWTSKCKRAPRPHNVYYPFSWSEISRCQSNIGTGTSTSTSTSTCTCTGTGTALEAFETSFRQQLSTKILPGILWGKSKCHPDLCSTFRAGWDTSHKLETVSLCTLPNTLWSHNDCAWYFRNSKPEFGSVSLKSSVSSLSWQNLETLTCVRLDETYAGLAHTILDLIPEDTGDLKITPPQ